MKRITLLLLFFFPLFVISQIKIEGIVHYNSEPISWANVVLLDSQRTIVTGETTKENGSFILKAASGKYELVISYLGFEDWRKIIQLDNSPIDLGIITLVESTNKLQEVELIHRKKLIEQQSDRIIFNVENSVVSQGGNALDAFRAAPGLRVQNNSINMFGRDAVQVMVNGKLLPLTGEELVSYLNSIASSDIKKIEIITAPPAKYDASGNGGLLNIVLKQGRINSWKNTTSLSTNFNTYNFTTLSNNLLYNKEKISFSLSLNKTNGHLRGLEDFQVYYPSSTWNIDIKTKDNQEDFATRLLLDYKLTNKTTIGIQYLGNLSNPDIEDVTISSIYNQNNSLDSLLINKGVNRQEIKNHTINFHSLTNLDTIGRTISFDLDYLTYNSGRNHNFKTNSFSPDNTFLNRNASANTLSDLNIQNISFKTDFEHPLQLVNLSYGAKVSFINNKSEIQFFNTLSGNPVFDSGISNQFEYSENIQALYVNAMKKINKKWSFQMGLRLENTKTKGFSVNLNQLNTNDYLKLFPTVYASYARNDNNSFSFSYSKRIQRPNFGNLNPFRVYVSSNTYSEGNPFLQPSFNNNFEIKHIYKDIFTTNIFVNSKNQGSGIIFNSNVANSTQIVTRENYYNQVIYGIGESIGFNRLKWLQSQNNVTIFGSNTSFTKEINAKPKNGMAFSVSSSNRIIINETSNFQLDATYDSKLNYGLFSVGEMYSFDLGANKSFLDKSLRISFLIKDIFNTSSLNNYASVVNGINQVYGQNRNNRYIRLSASYTFGNKTIKEKKKNFGNEEEQRRSN
jgi:outer membrane receptor protein involved in Fe transport